MKRNKLPQFVGRLITAIIIFGITAFFTPGFTVSSIWIVALAVLLLAVCDFAISTFTALFTHPIVKGIIGFVLCAITLYVVQYVVTGYGISWISALLGALVYAIVDYMLPAEDESTHSHHIHHATV